MNSSQAARPIPMRFQETSGQVGSSIDQMFFTQNDKWDYEFSFSSNPAIIPGVWLVKLPIREFKQIDLDGHQLLTKQSTHWDQKYKVPFKDAFRELAAVDAPFEDSPVSSAEKILDAEAKRTGEAFEAAGLKIPADIAVRCGVLLVLGVQFYVLIHLREFGNRPGPSVPTSLRQV
jgi:hypothetical protein